ncbi:DNA mismatch repair protein [Vibrio sp. SCSIO 43136]|uniref:DNA mismatch repair protein n=1 Tax=Vibrio sp. SCSIO 43136 TaxID=2819101 RepID=UPI00207618C5|nr:DNA mismatch repair protein [Vibrio sp. SCSIO 43136]USD67972.1 DNA mismatch repair protein [Vibrio sp. SCSIO 43136]
MKWLKPPAWVVVLMGLMLNVVALIITGVQLDQFEHISSELEREKTQHLYAIDRAWERINTLERKRETLVLFTAMPEEQQAQGADFLKQQLSVWIGTDVALPSQQTLGELNQTIDLEQANQRNQIDDYYLQIIDISEIMKHQQEQYDYYKNLALFFQVFGLALILARDLARRP